MTATKNQTNLLFEHVGNIDKANEKFGACKDGNTIIILQPGRNPLKPYIRIPEGTYAIVQNNGKDLDYVYPDGRVSPVWPAGFHYASPFTKVAYLVTKQNVVFDTPVKGCKTADDVSVHIDLNLVFRIMGDEERGEDPNLVKRFVYELRPQGLQTQLRDAQEEAVRALARSVQHTEVYSLRDGTLKERFTNTLQMRPPAPISPLAPNADEETKDEDIPLLRALTLKDPDAEEEQLEEMPPPAKFIYSVTEDMRESLNKQFNPYGVEICSVSITNVYLPPQFVNQMEEKTTYLSAIKEQAMKQQSDMQLLQYKEEIDTTKLAKRMRRMEETEAGARKCAEIQKEIDVIRADTKKMQEQINREKQVRCSKIKADADLEIARITAETKLIEAEVNAACEVEISKIRAEKNALLMKMEADVARLQALGEARAKEIISTAEGIASTKLAKQREFLLQMQRVEITQALAENKHVVISGENNSNDLLANVLVSQQKQNLLLSISPPAKA